MTGTPADDNEVRAGPSPAMRRLATLCAFGLVAIAVSLIAPIYTEQLDEQLKRPIGVLPKPPQPECTPIELSGTLRRASKWYPTLDLVPAMSVRSFALEGRLLDDVPAGTHLWVKGVVRSGLYPGGTKEHPSPWGPQWIVKLHVTELEVLDDPLIVLRRKRAQAEAARDAGKKAADQ